MSSLEWQWANSAEKSWPKKTEMKTADRQTDRRKPKNKKSGDLLKVTDLR